MARVAAQCPFCSRAAAPRHAWLRGVGSSSPTSAPALEALSSLPRSESPSGPVASVRSSASSSPSPPPASSSMRGLARPSSVACGGPPPAPSFSPSPTTGTPSRSRHRVPAGHPARPGAPYVPRRSHLRDRRARPRYVTKGDRESSALLRRLHRRKMGRGWPAGSATPRSSRRVGIHGRHPLRLFEDINERYTSTARSTRSSAGAGARRVRLACPAATASSSPARPSKLGSYSGVDRMIRVHPALDQEVGAASPSWPTSSTTRCSTTADPREPRPRPCQLPPPEFREREREFRHFERAMACAGEAPRRSPAARVAPRAARQERRW